MERNKVVLASVASVLVVGGAVFFIVNKNKSEETSSSDVSSHEEHEDGETVVSDEDEFDFDFEDIEGTYEGSAKYSSAVLKANDDLKSASVLVTFRDSKTSSNFNRWSMTVRPDLDWLRANESSDVIRLSYSDCSEEKVEVDGSGNEKVAQKVYSGGKGHFDLDDDHMIWNDNMFEEGDALRGCKFTKK